MKIPNQKPRDPEPAPEEDLQRLAVAIAKRNHGLLKSLLYTLLGLMGTGLVAGWHWTQRTSQSIETLNATVAANHTEMDARTGRIEHAVDRVETALINKGIGTGSAINPYRVAIAPGRSNDAAPFLFENDQITSRGLADSFLQRTQQ